jgi:hypothetical protein
VPKELKKLQHCLLYNETSSLLCQKEIHDFVTFVNAPSVDRNTNLIMLNKGKVQK